MKITPRRLFFCWSVLVLTLTIVKSLKLLQIDQFRDLLSPRFLSYAVAASGPLPMWSLLVFSYLNAGITTTNVHTSHWISLLVSASFYFSLIFFIRKGKEITISRWDPSGHLFIYALQLIPSWSWLEGDLSFPSLFSSSSFSSSTSFVVLPSLSSSSTTTTSSLL